MIFQRVLAPGNSLPAGPRTLLSSNPLGHWECRIDEYFGSSLRTWVRARRGAYSWSHPDRRCRRIARRPVAVADLDKTFSPISRTTNSTCERVEHESTPQRLKWRLQCTGQIDMDVAGEFMFDSPEHYTAVITARSFMLGRLMQSIRTSVEGQRVGDCP